MIKNEEHIVVKNHFPFLQKKKILNNIGTLNW